MLKKEHAAVIWKNSSPPRGVGPKTTYVQQELQEPPQKKNSRYNLKGWDKF